MSSLVSQLRSLGVDLDPSSEDRLLLFLDELLRWNRRINLTAITDREEAIEKHLVDALSLLPLLPATCRLLDLGSGAGLPGIPLQIVRPGVSVYSVDAVQKKILFQRHVARLLNLQNFVAWHGRAEEIPLVGDVPLFDVVVARAFTALPGLAVLAAPCLRLGGRLLAMKGPEGEGEWQTGALACQALGFDLVELRHFTLPKSGAARTVILLQKGN